jgi:hypothetical protein
VYASACVCTVFLKKNHSIGTDSIDLSFKEASIVAGSDTQFFFLWGASIVAGWDCFRFIFYIFVEETSTWLGNMDFFFKRKHRSRLGLF